MSNAFFQGAKKVLVGLLPPGYGPCSHQVNVTFLPLRLCYEKTCTSFSKEAENLTTYHGCMYSGFTFSHYELLFPTRDCISYVSRMAWGCSRIPNPEKFAIIRAKIFNIWAKYTATFTCSQSEVVFIFPTKAKQHPNQRQNNGQNSKIIWDYFAIIFAPDGKIDTVLE